MALWQKAQHLLPEALPQVHGIYGEHFPVEVRHFLAPWIEEKIWSDFDPDNPQNEKYALELFTSFLQEIETKANSMVGTESFPAKLKLLEAVNSFKQRFSYNPAELFRLIRNCLLSEMRLVEQAESMSQPNGMDQKRTYFMGTPNFAQLNTSIDTARAQTQEISSNIKALDSEQESFSLNFHEYQKIKDNLKNIETVPEYRTPAYLAAVPKFRATKQQLEVMLQQKERILKQYQVHIMEKLKSTYLHVSNLIHEVHNTELVAWKRNQQLHGNGSDFDPGHLDIIQSWCDSLAEISWANQNQYKEMKRLAQMIGQFIGETKLVTNAIIELDGKFTELLSSLVTNTFVIEKQPPQVMKTNTRFSAKVRLLVGGKLNLYMNPPQVKVSIISEQQANILLTENIIKGDVSGEILNNTGTMEYEQATKQLSITFRNMQLKKIKRAEKKGSESVVDEKFSLLFTSKFKVGGEIDAHVYTLSLPVTVIVHGNQEPHAWATITWDNAFAEPARKPFIVPDKVSWGKVAIALNMKFASVTGKHLSNDNLKYLAEKLFRVQSDDYDSMTLSWSQFCKENLPDRNFTFWDWFYAIMKLTKEHLKTLWVDGTIHGFVRKRQAEEMLSMCPNGTFLLRYSDSELGGITIAWVGAGNGEQKQVTMVHPFTSKDFAIRTLPDRLNDLAHLVYLYPEIPKEKAFGKYYTPFIDSPSPSTNGYVKPILITHLPGFSLNIQPLGIHSAPQTPQSMFQPNSPSDVASIIGADLNHRY
ncbi:signal transducer and activator of transcription 5B-like isoform X2 [Planococcus citri]|uniref:signal transducer and activator of transcription 5B-like isoform X2 n=1 Tax=Planococcus citri TaxID=170843 RepID=UPI0031F9970A